MRNPLVAPLLLLLLPVPAARAAPRAGGHGLEAPAAPWPDPGPDPLSPELPSLPLLRGAVRSLAPPERDAEALTREQALLYLFALHDYDRSGRLDGLELLELVGAVLAQRGGGRPDPHETAALVDRALERQDLGGDGLLDPLELLLWPPRGPPGQPPPQPPGEPPAGTGAVPGGAAEAPGGDTGVNGPAEAEAAPQAEAPDAEAAEVDEAPEAEGPNPGAVEAEETPENEVPEAGTPTGDTSPGWGDAGVG